MGDGFCLRQLWKLLICVLQDRRKHHHEILTANVVSDALPLSGHRLSPPQAPTILEPLFFPIFGLMFLLLLSATACLQSTYTNSSPPCSFLCPPHTFMCFSPCTNVCKWHKRPFQCQAWSFFHYLLSVHYVTQKKPTGGELWLANTHLDCIILCFYLSGLLFLLPASC
jgi:hypothetical protein